MKKHVAFAFGRFNPPTVGHKKLIDTVVDASDGGDFYIFTSQSQDPDKNPLDYQTKVNFLKKLFPDIQDKIVYDVSIKNVLQAADKLKANGYTDATFVCGSDRVPEFTKLLNTWNGMDKTPRFGTLNIVSSGEREDGVEGVEGVSASMAREFVKNNDFESFKGTVPNNPQLAKELFDAVKQGMATSKKKIKESLIKLINEILMEDDAKIKAATKKTNQALVLQRELEKRAVDDKIKIAQEKSKTSTSPEDKSKSAEELKKLSDELKSKQNLVKSAKEQLQSSN
jgi:nicotinic acid mononucleotide adenylyltransferase